MSRSFCLAACAAGALFTAASDAAALRYLDQQRSATVDALASVLDFGHGELQSAHGHDAAAAAPGDFGPFTAGVYVNGLFVSGYGANASADGYANQSSTLAGDGISYASTAALFVAGSSGFPGIPSVSGLAASLISVRFALDTALALTLAMHSDPNGGFEFRLRDAAGTTVWDQTNTYSPATGPQFDFTVVLALAAGEYVLDAALSAYGSYDNDTATSSQTFGDFTLTAPLAVSAPHPLALLGAGLGAGAWQARRTPVRRVRPSFTAPA